MTMIKPLVSALIAASLTACSAPVSSEPYAAWDDSAKETYKELSLEVPAQAEVGIPPYPGAKIIAPVNAMSDDGSLCNVMLGVTDQASKVKDFYAKEVGQNFTLMDAGHLYMFTHKEDADVSIHVMKDGMMEGYNANILITFKALQSYRCTG